MFRNRYRSNKGILQSPINARYAGTEQLLSGEHSLDSYNRFLVTKFFRISQKFGSSSNPKVLDFGAGIGTLAVLWRDLFEIEPYCLEIDALQNSELHKRGFKVKIELSEIDEKFNVIYTSNVLEHIENDLQSLIQLRDKLEPDGLIVIYVPAFMLLYSGLDESVGHYRRYSKKELVQKVAEAGFNLKKCEYVDTIGFPASLAIRFLGYKGIGNVGGNRSLAIYDRWIFPISRFLDVVGFKYLFGKNLLLIAQKTKTI